MNAIYSESDESITSRLADILLPYGGWIVTLAEVYVDESGTHDGSPVLAVGGHIYFKNAASSFDQKWAEYLASKGLPYFRMTDCAHRTGPFKGWSDDACDVVERELISMIRTRSEMGFVTTLNEAEFMQCGPKAREVGGAYSFSLRMCLSHVRAWIEKTKFKGQVAYFFEAGHKHQTQANGIMNDIFADPQLRDHFHYAAHAFADKKQVRPLQAADLLAWQFHTDGKRKRAGRRDSRKDLIALVRDADMAMEWNKENLVGLTSFLFSQDRLRKEQIWSLPPS